MNGGNPTYFLEYALQGFVDALDSHIDAILKEQVSVAWTNYVHDRFRQEAATKVNSRQRELLLAISTVALESPVSKREILSKVTLNAKLSKQYENHQRMFQRDINSLVKMKLLEKNSESKYMPALNIIMSSYISPCVKEQ